MRTCLRGSGEREGGKSSSSEHPSSFIFVDSSTKSFSRFSVFVALLWGQLPDFGVQGVCPSFLRVPGSQAVKKNGKPCGGTHRPNKCTNSEVPEPRGSGRTHTQPTPLPQSHDVCDDLSDFDPDLCDAWRNWRVDDPVWENDCEPERALRDRAYQVAESPRSS